jgi:integrase
MAQKLKQGNLRQFRYGGKATAKGGWSRDLRWDTEVPGFGVRVYPSGEKAFVFSYRINGRKRLMRIGRCNTMTLTQARDRAKKHDVTVSDGNDPLADRQRKRTAGTFRELVEKYIEDQEAKKRKTWAQTKKQLDRHIPIGWWGRTAGSISATEITALHSRIGKTTPYMANRILETMRAMFHRAGRWGFDVSENPAEGIEKFREVKRKRFVTEQEFPALAQAIDAEPNVYIRAALWLYLLSGARKNELLEARWSQVDWKQRILNLPESKAGEPQTISLNKPAIAILQAIPETEGNPYIFPGMKSGRHLVNITKAWGRIRKAAKIEDVRIHDLRRTVGSWLSRDSVDLNQIKEALRHASISTTLTYARLGADPARKAMESHGERIMKIAGSVRPVNGDGI